MEPYSHNFPYLCKWPTHQSSQRISNYVWEVSKEVPLEASTLLGSGVMVFCLLASSSLLCLGSTLNILLGDFHRWKPINMLLLGRAHLCFFFFADVTNYFKEKVLGGKSKTATVKNYSFPKTGLNWNWKPCAYIYIYINKDGNPSTKSTRHVEANVNTQKGNQDHQNNYNEVEDIMLKGHTLSQIS